MRRYASIAAALLVASCPVSAGAPLAPSEPVVRGTIRGDFAYGSQCLSVPAVEYLPGVYLEMRPCRNSVDQIFEWNVVSFEIKIHNLCVDALRSGPGSSQPGDPVGLWYCQGKRHQQWFPFRSNPYLPTFSIVGGGGPASNLCLESLYASTVAGTPLLIAYCNGGDNQQFRTQPWPALDDMVSSGPFSQSRVLLLD
ncbi:MAG: RICIN domain-containing protein [Rhizobiales bacterium]|nr:RICIN domain-containing protein [Hyphomicrobiales bacterium]